MPKARLRHDVLLFGDESEALTHPYLARAWAKRGADLRVPAPGQAKKVAMIGSLDHATRRLIVHTSRTKCSRDFIAHLEQLDRLYGPMPGRVMKPTVLVLDNGPIHTRKMSRAALAAREHWLTAGFARDVVLTPASSRPDEMPAGFDEPQADFERPIVESVVARPFRDQAFARQVRLAYDNRCAVTGLRLINGGGRAGLASGTGRSIPIVGSREM